MNAYLLVPLILLGCAAVFAGVMTIANPDEIAAALRRIADSLESVKKDRHDRDIMGIEVLGDIKGLLGRLVDRTDAPVARAYQPPAAAGPTLWEICSKRDGDWHHAAWVREGTDTYHEAFRTPGVALRRGDHVDEGVQ